jgi:hypothetical protein
MMFREGSAEGSRRKYTEEPTSHVQMNSGSLYTIHGSDRPQLQTLVFGRGPKPEYQWRCLFVGRVVSGCVDMYFPIRDERNIPSIFQEIALPSCRPSP